MPGNRVSRSFKLCEFIFNKILSSFLVFYASQPKKIYIFSFTLENGRGRTRITRCTTGSFNAAVAYLPGNKGLHVWKFYSLILAKYCCICAFMLHLYVAKNLFLWQLLNRKIGRMKTRTNWPRKVRELILDSDSRAQGVKGYAFRVPGGQWVGFHGPRGSRGRPIGSQRVKG